MAFFKTSELFDKKEDLDNFKKEVVWLKEKLESLDKTE